MVDNVDTVALTYLDFTKELNPVSCKLTFATRIFAFQLFVGRLVEREELARPQTTVVVVVLNPLQSHQRPPPFHYTISWSETPRIGKIDA